MRAAAQSIDEYLKSLIRDIPDFPQKGILFKDISTLLKDGKAFAAAVDTIADHYRAQKVTHVVGIESRGFILGAAISYALKAGFVPVRKKGKLPYKTYQVDYALEYGRDTLEIHKDALSDQCRVLVVDDLLATGGTVQAVLSLVQNFKAEIAGISFLIELSFLKGRLKIDKFPVHSIIQY